MSLFRTQHLKAIRSMPLSEGHLMFSAALFITSLNANRGGAAAQAAKGSRHTALLHADYPFQHSIPNLHLNTMQRKHTGSQLVRHVAHCMLPHREQMAPLTWELCLREPVDLKTRLSLTMLPSLWLLLSDPSCPASRLP